MTYISAEVLNAFGLEFANPDTAIEVQINGRRTTVMMSKPYFKDVCLIGMEFMIVSNADLCVSSSNRTFTLKFYNWLLNFIICYRYSLVPFLVICSLYLQLLLFSENNNY